MVKIIISRKAIRPKDEHQSGIGRVVEKRFGFSCNLRSILTFSIIFCGIQVKGEYVWRRFVLDGRRGFPDYSTVVPSDGWRPGFHASVGDKGLTAVNYH
ncbi:hypothetical protein Hanom_Chr08g00750931 [Helianthus anomalus]